MNIGKKRVDLLAVLEQDVLGTGGEPLGEIDRLVANIGDGRLEQAVLRLADDSTGPPRYVVIPWSQFSLSANRRQLQLDFSLKLLKTVGTGSR